MCARATVRVGLGSPLGRFVKVVAGRMVLRECIAFHTALHQDGIALLDGSREIFDVTEQFATLLRLLHIGVERQHADLVKSGDVRW